MYVFVININTFNNFNKFKLVLLKSEELAAVKYYIESLELLKQEAFPDFIIKEEELTNLTKAEEEEEEEEVINNNNKIDKINYESIPDSNPVTLI